MDAEARLAEIRRQQKVVDDRTQALEGAKEIVRKLREQVDEAVAELGDIIREKPLFDAESKGGDEA